jgi:hypothetical protein
MKKLLSYYYFPFFSAHNSFASKQHYRSFFGKNKVIKTGKSFVASNEYEEYLKSKTPIDCQIPNLNNGLPKIALEKKKGKMHLKVPESMP